MKKAKDLTEHVTNKAIALIKKVHGTTIGAKEFSGGWMPERVDALLFKTGISFLIETKISRSDFLADAKKDFRINPENGVGMYRYYACPEGLISVEELPDKWGLIYVPEGRAKAYMPVGYGGTVFNPAKDTKHPEHGWTVRGFDRYGSDNTRPEGMEIEEWWNHPEYPANKYRFERCLILENQYLYALATRYKKQKFMDNIL